MTKKISGTLEWATTTVNCTIGCPNDCRYCVDEDTLVLMATGVSKKIKDIISGDEVIGFSEEGRSVYTKATVIDIWKTKRPAYKITLEDGTSVVCSGNHKWRTDRGWKYTTGSEQGPTRRPFLTTNRRIKSIGDAVDPSLYIPTEGYIRGYLSGMIRGDGTMGHYSYQTRNRKYEQFQFRLALKDEEGVSRTKKYLELQGVYPSEFWFKSPDRPDLKAVRTSKKSYFVKIAAAIEYDPESLEFRRGFIAGLFDAKGNGGYKSAVIRISNTDDYILDFLVKSLSLFQFETVEDVPKDNGCRCIRIRGGLKEVVRFFQVFTPAIPRKFNFEGLTNHSLGKKIKEIKDLGQLRSMYDLTTTSGTFIANGLLSHNCYAKRIAAQRKNILRYSEWSKKNETRRNKNREKTKYKGTVMFPSMHDIFPKNLEVCIDVIANLLEAGNKVLITSKPNYNCIKELCETFVEYKHAILFRFTIGTSNNEILKLWEPGAPNFKERFDTLTYTFSEGFKTSVSMEPMLDSETVVNDVRKMLPYISDSIWIGKMNKIDDRVTTISRVEKDRIKAGQTDEEIFRIYNELKDNPRVRWKESFKEVLGLELQTKAGTDR